MIDYQLLRAKNLNEALEILESKKNIRCLAGGTDILVDLHHKDDFFEKVDYLLDISSIEELKGINLEGEYGEIGSMTTHSEIINHQELNQKLPFTAAAAQSIGSTQIRNRATIGGNLVNAAACADSFSPMIALEAEVVLASKRGERKMSIRDFITSPYRTKLAEDELLKKIIFPMPQGEYYSSYQKIGRRKAVSISRISLTLLAEVKDEKIEKIQVVSGAATPSPVPFERVNSYLMGRRLAEIDSAEAGGKAAEEMVEITGRRWSTPYKQPALSKLVERAVDDMLEEAGYNG